jgi:hypothetical protein
MGKFVSTEVPAWRIVLWGVVAVLAVVALGFFSSGHFDYRVLLLALFVGTLFSSFGFFLLWSARSGWTARHLKPLLIVFIVGQVVLFVWTILERQK